MSSNMKDETTETWVLTGQELVNFVLKSSESLHNVINRANVSSIQTINAKKKSLKRKVNLRNKISKSECKPCKKNCGQDFKNQESAPNFNSLTPAQPSLDYDFELTSSSCEELNEIPMEDLLSSPTWKEIVEKNSFIWP